MKRVWEDIAIAKEVAKNNQLFKDKNERLKKEIKSIKIEKQAQ